MDKKALKYGELFCGPGGLAKGALLAGQESLMFDIEHSWATDIDTNACKTYGFNICGNENDNSIINKPIDEVNIETDLSKVDILAFGFPCNDFSLVGKQEGLHGTFGPLYSYGVKYLQFHQPNYFIAENVTGLQSANDGKAFTEILEAFIVAGYRLTIHEYKFEYYGVPQKRHRIIVAGIRNDIFSNESYIHVAKPECIDKSEFATAEDAIENPKIHQDAFNNEQTKHPTNTIERLKHIAPGESIWSAKNMPDKYKLKETKNTISHIYRRLEPNKPSYTVTGSGGGGTHMYHWKENRALTNREKARLQTFDDDYKFFGSKENVRKQIGMAVPPKGSKRIFTALLKSIELKGEFDTNHFEEASIGSFNEQYLSQLNLF